MAWKDVIGGVGRVETSLIESQKFKRTIGRFVVGECWSREFKSESALQNALLEICDSDKHELTVVRVPSSLLGLLNRTKFKRRSLLFVGTLVYWEMRLGVDTEIPFVIEAKIQTAENLAQENYPEIFRVLDSSFTNYRNHYTSNPLLELSSATDSYHDWAHSVLVNNPENVVLVSLDEKIAGLAVISPNSGGPVEILLAGIGEGFQRRGAYISLLSGICHIARERGFDHIVISTQSWNISVQKAWTKAGFSPVLSIDTFHSLALD